MVAPSEPLSLRKTVIGSEAAPDDYLVIWDGLPIGRILKQPGVPDGRRNWSWGVIFPRRPQLTWQRGLSGDFEEAKQHFRLVWTAVHRELTDEEVEVAREDQRDVTDRPWNRHR